MSRVSDMQNTVEGIKTSKDCRIKTLKELVINTNTILNDARTLVTKFIKDHKDMGNELRATLAEGVDSLKKDDVSRVKAAKAMLAVLSKDSATIASIWKSLTNKECKFKKSKKSNVGSDV